MAYDRYRRILPTAFQGRCGRLAAQVERLACADTLAAPDDEAGVGQALAPPAATR